jgi:hypothetical protein
MIGFSPNTSVYDNKAFYSYSIHVLLTRHMLETESIVKHFSLTLGFPEISHFVNKSELREV